MDRIEAGDVTFEDLQRLGKTYPVFIYRTCITIHGAFPEVAAPRVNGYKNVIQNGNGSLEVRYSAIDAGKFYRMKTLLKATDSPYSLFSNSQGYSIERRYPLTKENFAAQKAAVAVELERLKTLGIYGHCGAFRANIYGQHFIILYVTPLAIPRAEFEAFAAILVDREPGQLKAIAEQYEAEREAQSRRWEREQEERYKANELKKAAGARAIKPFESAIANLKPAPASPEGYVFVTAKLDANEQPYFRLIRMSGKFQSFKRFYLEAAKVQRLEDAAGATFKRVTGFGGKETLFTLADFKKYYANNRILCRHHPEPIPA